MAFGWAKKVNRIFSSTAAEARPRLFRAVQKNDVETVRKIAEEQPGGVLSWRSDKGSVLYVAQKNGSLDVFKLLADIGADINEDYGQGWTPLLMAVKKGQKDFLGYLLDKGAKLDSVAITEDHSKGGWPNPYDYGTALHLAVERGDREIVIQLLERGASPSITAEIGAHNRTPVEHAKWFNRTAIIPILDDAEAIRVKYLDHQEQLKSKPVKTATEKQIVVRAPLRLRRPTSASSPRL